MGTVWSFPPKHGDALKKNWRCVWGRGAPSPREKGWGPDPRQKNSITHVHDLQSQITIPDVSFEIYAIAQFETPDHNNFGQQTIRKVIRNYKKHR